MIIECTCTCHLHFSLAILHELRLSHSVLSLQYYDIQNIAVGTFGFLESEDDISPMNMCIYKYTNSSVEPEVESYHLTRQTSYCILLQTFPFVSLNCSHFTQMHFCVMSVRPDQRSVYPDFLLHGMRNKHVLCHFVSSWGHGFKSHSGLNIFRL